ncbi:MAG: hypothetical protein KGZ65_04375 [Sphingomonadales bacterium]|nr:hypothetical protein [Sphingomonadaceae bacterium]MBS3930450.1 hypothetical protein [Sphingomonadales bacterium]
MNITADGVAAVCAVIVVVGGAIGAYLAVVDRRQAAEIKDLKDAAKEAKDEMTRRIDGFHSSVNSQMRDAENLRRDLERRLGEVQREHITRTDQAEFRAEMLSTVDKVGDRIGHSIDKLSSEIREDMKAISKRVSDVEARS